GLSKSLELRNFVDDRGLIDGTRAALNVPAPNAPTYAPVHGVVLYFGKVAKLSATSLDRQISYNIVPDPRLWVMAATAEPEVLLLGGKELTPVRRTTLRLDGTVRSGWTQTPTFTVAADSGGKRAVI